MIREELEEYWRAENALRNKVFGYFDKLNKKIDFYLLRDGERYEIHFVEIKNKLIKDDGGDWWDYRSFNTGEILDLWDDLEQDIKEVL